jgi:hypothetical protein
MWTRQLQRFVKIETHSFRFLGGFSFQYTLRNQPKQTLRVTHWSCLTRKVGGLDPIDDSLTIHDVRFSARVCVFFLWLDFVKPNILKICTVFWIKRKVKVTFCVDFFIWNVFTFPVMGTEREKQRERERDRNERRDYGVILLSSSSQWNTSHFH